MAERYAGIESFRFRSTVKKPAEGWPIDETIVSCDPGNGKISAWIMMNGKPYSVNLPHGRVRATGGSFAGVEGMATAPMTYITWRDQRYAVGQGAWELAAYAPETFRNSERRYGSDHHICMTMTALAALEAPTDKPITVIIPCPPGLLTEAKRNEIRAAFLAGESGANDGRWTIQLNNEKPDTYTIKNVVVVAEGIGGYAAYRWDANGELVELWDSEHQYDLLTGHFRIVDLGYGTANSYSIYNGSIATETITHATNEQGGLHYKMIRPILDRIHDLPGAKSITDAHVEGWIRRWVQSNYDPAALEVQIGSNRVSLGGFVHGLMESYADWVIQEILEPGWNLGVNTVGEIGGGWQFADMYVRRAYKGRDIITPSMFTHIKHIPLYDLNGYGGLVFAANNRRVHAKKKA